MSKKHIIYATIVILLIAGVALFSRLRHQQKEEEITLKDTPAVIESSRPIGTLYLYTTVTEDYAKDTFWGSGLGSSLLGKNNGILKKKHDCVQILKQQVNLTLDLDAVQYQTKENSDTVWVKLPPVEFSQSTVSSWFKSDDEDEESAVQYDAEPLIKRVERRIEARYNTLENRQKAEKRAQKTITDFLKQCGKTAVFM